jgi:hypothetical protein
MSKTRSLIAVLTCIALVAGSPALLADPGNGKGNPHKSEHGNKGKGNYGDHGPTIDVGGIRVIFDHNREYWGSAQPLPPGIQKNLARGKPLPPGIAKKLDGRLVGRLPHYDGYEWVQAGTDVILIAIATGIIHEVLHDVLD